MANKFETGNTNLPGEPKVTYWHPSINDAWQTWLGIQTARVVENYAKSGYEVMRVGTRPTKNDEVELWRAEVKYPAGHPRSIVRTNVNALIRAIFPGIQSVDLYEPDEVKEGLCVAVWFAFNSQPLTKFS